LPFSGAGLCLRKSRSWAPISDGEGRHTQGDRWGAGNRVPAIIVSPFAKRGFVDHTQYDTTSILRLITRRFALPMLPGLQARDEALAANGSQPMGDLTNARVVAMSARADA
jgi:phospholipase C